jgi:aryl-alcohol dehydrogenase-like predicted oxidoreductase
MADTQFTPRVNEGCITYDIDDSLKNLGIERIDLYWLHRDNPTYPVYLIVDALLAAQDSGKIAHFGASNWSAGRISEANAYARSAGREGFIASQVQYSYAQPLGIESPATRYFDEELDGQVYIDEKISLFSFTSLAKGYMSKTLGGVCLSENVKRLFDCPVNRERAARASEIARQVGGGHNAEQIGLAYLHSMPYNIVTLVSYNGIKQLEDSMDCDIALTREQIDYLGRDDSALDRKPQPTS